MNSSSPERVSAYIDGFNLYFGLRDAGFQRYYWLNLQSLAGNLLKPNQRLVHTKYFTARISGPPPGNRSRFARRLEDKRRRQGRYLEALATLSDFSTFYGHYLPKRVTCNTCGASWRSHEEKMTDVNIATEMLTDAYQDVYDTALLVSADSDLVAPVRAIQRLFPDKRVVVGLPPARHSKELVNAAGGYLFIKPPTLAKSQFPEQITKSDGFVLQRPPKWK